MRLKDSSVKLEGMSWRLWHAALVAEQVYKEFGFSDLTITSANDGKHSVDSLHYKGLAIDVRTWHIAKISLTAIAGQINRALGKDFDVVIEIDHIHIEYDPKG